MNDGLVAPKTSSPANEIAHVRADLLDNTGYFGAKDQRIRVRQSAIAGSDQRVPRAYTCRPNSDQNLLMSRLRNVDALDDNNLRRPRLVDSCCLHDASFR